MREGNRFGLHRVIAPEGVLPQPATRIDNTMEIYDNEILINVETLNIDSASFRQLKSVSAGDVEKIKSMILEIVRERGKMQNPVTGSGGMLIGTVAEVGSRLKDRDLKVGDKIVSLVSLSLTPLKIDQITRVMADIDQVHVEAQAILFESGIYAKLPDDVEETLALAVLDVAGAPAQTAKLVGPGDTVLIIGAGGKSGLLCLHEAKKRAGISGTVIGMSHSDTGIGRVKRAGLADIVIQGDASKPVELYDRVMEATNGRLADVVINNVNIPNTEMGSILSTRENGVLYFFSMATSFTKAALGAEGVGKDINMIIGNGYTKNHADVALQILKENPVLREMFEELYT
ncbi:MAG: L-erythro-3,5-diaminohexanoate dehydrogenase [Spirochaetales bacterium]|nr:L-erythro-3,5-diaminohexanoate dehydrogenase [Spirochaetales bacterium]